MKTDGLKQLIRSNIRELRPFPSAALQRNKLGISSTEAFVLLESNENPNDLFGFHRYPEPQPTKLLELLSGLYSVKSNQICITRGSAEGIELIIRLFCEPGKDKLLTLWPSFELVEHFANLHGVQVIKQNLSKENGFDLSIADVDTIKSEDIKLIYLNSPNNPTGNLLNRQTILSICQTFVKKAVVIVDEAYIEYSSQESLVSYIDQCENLIVLRTLSKAFSLAGLRCGAILTNSEIVDYLKIMMHPAPVPQHTIELVESALSVEGLQKIKETIRGNHKQRSLLSSALNQFTFVKKVYPSETNFILIEVLEADALIQFCVQRNILLRDKSKLIQLEGCIRITIGTAEENNKLLSVLAEYEGIHITKRG